MAFMFTDLGGTIRIGRYTPEGSIPLGKGKEEQLRAAALTAEAVLSAGVLSVPGITVLPTGPDGYFARKDAINVFARRVEAILKGGA